MTAFLDGVDDLSLSSVYDDEGGAIERQFVDAIKVVEYTDEGERFGSLIV